MKKILLVCVALLSLSLSSLAGSSIYCSDFYDEGFEREACVTGFMYMVAGEGERDERKVAAETDCEEKETYVSACKQGVLLGSLRINTSGTRIAR
jgi:hypothetical protein